MSHKIFEAVVVGIILISLVSADSYLTEQPIYIPPCKIYEPGFTKCSTNSIQKLFEQLGKGIPGLEKVSAIDPFLLKKVVYKQDNNQVATISANLTDLVVKGFGKTIVKESKVSKKDFSWETKFVVPKMRIDGNYKMDGKVLVVPLKGNGKMFMEIDNMNAIMYTKTRLYEKGGFVFYNVTSVRLDISIGGFKTRFDNLFNGNKELEENTNAFFNTNWPDFFEALRPVVTQTVEKILLRVLQTVFHSIPANFFVSDIPKPNQLYGN